MTKFGRWRDLGTFLNYFGISTEIDELGFTFAQLLHKFGEGLVKSLREFAGTGHG